MGFMEIVPELRLVLWGGWWFSAIYVILHFLLIFAYPKEVASRLFTLPDPEGKLSRLRKVTYPLSNIIWYGTILLAVFVPIRPVSSWYFWLGTAIFVVGMAGYVVGWINYANTPLSEPVTSGLYRFSRNPIYVANDLVWFGIGIATGSWIIIALYIGDVIISYTTIRQEERFCLERYGGPYLQYMKRTHRYLGFPRRLSGRDD